MKKIMTIALLVVASTVAFAQKKMTQEIIDEHGTKVFDAPKAEIFALTKNVLESSGYEIDFENAEKGKIITKRKMIGASGVAVAPGAAQYRNAYRGYTATIESVSPERTKLVLTPKVWMGEADVSGDRVWVIKGNVGEIQLWKNFFNAMLERM